MGPGMIYSRLCPWKTQRSRGSGKIPLFLHSLGFFRTIPGCFHPPHVPPALPSLLDARWRIRKGTKTFPAHSGRSIPPILPRAPASIPLLRPSRWIFPARMGKGRTKTSFNWILGLVFFFLWIHSLRASASRLESSLRKRLPRVPLIPNPEDPWIFFPTGVIPP